MTMGVEQGGSFDGKSLGVAGRIYNISTEAARVPGGGYHDCMQATELFRLRSGSWTMAAATIGGWRHSASCTHVIVSYY